MNKTNEGGGGINSGAAGLIAGETNSLALGDTSNRVGRADNKAETFGSQINKMIILSSLMACMPKLEKQSRQPKNTSFFSCWTDVIWNAIFASHCLQEFGNLRLARPLFV